MNGGCEAHWIFGQVVKTKTMEVTRKGWELTETESRIPEWSDDLEIMLT
jgi:hypothetical protein